MIGSTLGRYRIDAEVASGGMGTVYRATGPAGVVAIKLLQVPAGGAKDAAERFRREAAIGLRVRHPNVVATLDVGETRIDGRPCHWIALEYVEGRTLAELRDELGRVPEDLCRHLGCEIAAGLAAIHATGAVHRDLKPENVLVTPDHLVKVADLGIARSGADDGRVTQTGVFVGSFEYASPEQLTGGGKGLDARSDLWALGVLLYELATGVGPFRARDWHAVWQKVVEGAPRRVGDANPQVSPFLEELVHKLLSRDPGRRFTTADAVAKALAEGEDSAWWRDRSAQMRAETRRPLRRVRVPREQALVGRDAEIARLRAAWAESRVCAGRVVVVEGGAGIGKSRLVHEFVRQLQTEGEDLSVVAAGAAAANGAFVTALREHLGPLDLDEAVAARLTKASRFAGPFAAFLRGDARPQGEEALTPDARHACFADVTRSLAAERPTVVFVDDLDVAPRDDLAIFVSLASVVARHRVMLVGAHRTGIDAAFADALDRACDPVRVPVPRLASGDVTRALAEPLGTDPAADGLALRIAQASDGNPFFVVEMLRWLRASGVIRRRSDGRWGTTRDVRDVAVPATIAELVRSRVAGLGPGDRSIVEVASCLGFEFDAWLVGDVLGLARIPLVRSLGAIERAHRLIRAVGPRFAFDLRLAQEHVAAGIPEFHRREVEASIAEAIAARSGAASDGS